MAIKVAGVRFTSPKLYTFAAGELELKIGDYVVVETQHGLELGKVKTLGEANSVREDTRQIVRVATAEDKKSYAELYAKRGAAISVIKEKIDARNLEMKVIDAFYTLDGGKLVVSFTAPTRVDFRELVRDLASAFHVRIELRQVGARDECRIMGGIAPCGRACCCSDHISELPHVSIKMAKTQGLSLKPGNISGLCGRLMCCLEYENGIYTEINKRLPRMGSTVTIKSDGKSGTVIGLNQLKESVRLKVYDGDSFEIADFALADIEFKGKTLSDEALAAPEPDEIKELLDD